MIDAFDKFADRYFNPEFFMQFADQALLKRLPSLTFAPGKLPQPAQVALSVSLGNEELAFSKDQTGGDVDEISGQRSCK